MVFVIALCIIIALGTYIEIIVKWLVLATILYLPACLLEGFRGTEISG